jgi:catechol 2,3-dioxygenase-like lactoylglutathione lyase family enzyme
MYSHITVGTSDIARSRQFYDAALDALGIGVCMELDGAVAYGDMIGTKFFVVPPFDDQPTHQGNGWHAAFAAQDRASVDAFHKAALANGGSDEGAPGLRPHYHPAYYAAYVRDPDGNKIQAVCHMPE